jgi:LuxR family maltose regulon positive regulatory protein
LISFLLPISIIWNIKINNLNVLKRFANHHALKESMEYFLLKKSVADEQRARLVGWAVESKIGGLAKAVNKFVHSSSRQLHMSSKKYIVSFNKFPLPPMIINTLGEYSINIDGRIVKFKRRKAKLLFSFLLTNYPHPIHEEKLIDMCFTGKSIRRPISNIRTIVSSIRKSLLCDSDGSDSYLEYADNMYSLKIPEQSKIDFMEIGKLHRRLMDSKQRVLTYSADDIQRIKSVLDLYKGDFLPEYRFEEFAAIAGEKIRNKYFGLLILLLEYLFENEDYAIAEKFVMEGLERDPIWTDGIRLAIKLFHRSGQSIKAMKLYRNYKRYLNEELGIEPSKEIQRLYERTIA